MIHAQDGTRGLLQNLLNQEECSSELVMVWTRHTPMTKWWRRKMRRATPASGAFSPGVLCPIARRGCAYHDFEWGMATRNKIEKKKWATNAGMSDQSGKWGLLQAARFEEGWKSKFASLDHGQMLFRQCCWTCVPSFMLVHLVQHVGQNWRKEPAAVPRRQCRQGSNQVANHDVAWSSYSAAFEHVAGFIKENVLNVLQTVCSVSITFLCDIFTSELREHGVEPRSAVPFNWRNVW